MADATSAKKYKYPFSDAEFWAGRHRCTDCNPDIAQTCGRDVWCPNYMRENIEAQLMEDSEDGRRIRAELAKEKADEERKKAGPQ